jgi:hypothetical protein
MRETESSLRSCSISCLCVNYTRGQTISTTDTYACVTVLQNASRLVSWMQVFRTVARPGDVPGLELLSACTAIWEQCMGRSPPTTVWRPMGLLERKFLLK